VPQGYGRGKIPTRVISATAAAYGSQTLMFRPLP